MKRRLYRSQTDRMIAGVAGGMADYFDVDPTIIRLIWLLLLLPGGIPGLILYIACAIIIPPAPTLASSEPTPLLSEQRPRDDSEMVVSGSTTTSSDTRD